MNNAFYHSVKTETTPNTSTEKADIVIWLEEKGEIINKPMVIRQLLDILRRNKPPHDKYLIDELAKEHGRTILRLTPYHRAIHFLN